MEHGKVTSVTYEEGVVYCDVRPIRTGGPYRDVPVMKPHSGFIQVPKQGETIVMEKLDDDTRFISDVMSRETETPDDMREGDLALQLDGGTRVRFEKNKDGDYNLHLDASGDVFVDGINFDEHVHPHDDSTIADTEGGSGTESTTTKETNPPKNP